MKNLLVVTAMIASSYAMADVDYSHCQKALIREGIQVTPQGDLSAPFGFQENPDKSAPVQTATGSEQVYTYKGHQLGLNGKPVEKKILVKRDQDQNIIGVTTSQAKIDAHTVQWYKQLALNGAIHSGLTPDSYTYDPMVTVSAPDAQNMMGKQVPLSKLTKEQAKQFGVDIDDLRKLRRQVRKDKKAMKKLADGYTKLLDKSNMILPNGMEVSMEIKDGICQVNSLAQIGHDVKAKKNVSGHVLNRERCEAVNKISAKYKSQLDSCAETNMKMMSELYPAPQQGIVGGVNGGAYPAAPMGGMGMGMGIGYPVGFGGGFGYGGYGQGAETFECQQVFGELSMGGYIGGAASGSAGGYGSGSSKAVKGTSTQQ